MFLSERDQVTSICNIQYDDPVGILFQFNAYKNLNRWFVDVEMLFHLLTLFICHVTFICCGGMIVFTKCSSLHELTVNRKMCSSKWITKIPVVTSFPRLFSWTVA